MYQIMTIGGIPLQLINHVTMFYSSGVDTIVMCQQFDPNFSSPEESVDGARHPEAWPMFCSAGTRFLLKLAKGVNPL